MNTREKEMEIEQMEAISGGPHYKDWNGVTFSNAGARRSNKHCAFLGCAITAPRGVVLRLDPEATFKD